MNHHTQKIFESLFAHPLGANVDYKDVLHLLSELGAEIVTKNGNKDEVHLQGQAFFLHRPHGHTLPKDEVARVRDFLTECGLTPKAA